MRRIVIECNVRGRDLGGFVDELGAGLTHIQRGLPTGYRIDIGGQFENQRRAMRRLAWVVPLAVGLICVFLFVAFGALRPAVLVLLNLPFALVGGVWVLFAGDIALSVSAAVGFVVLFGIAVENGVVLVSFFRQLTARGLGIDQAVIEGCLLRLRPLLMTTMTSLLGLAPMLFSSGSGSEIQRPLAAVVLGGLVTSTGLTLFVLPVLYHLVEGRFGPPPSCPEPTSEAAAGA
jgi:cobalt-zinc-cadmium resistance protein CzcA